MCGICGILNSDSGIPVSEDVLNRMANAITHRGPDDSGVHIDGSLGLGHRRLAIIDIEGGTQPLCDQSCSFWITYNGEIYNHRDLRLHLEKKGHRFKTNCDTEVVLYAFIEYGSHCVDMLNGMFAFAVWDAAKQLLFLARDRLGIKPLYYTKKNGSFIFASEIKALIEHPSVTAEVDSRSVPEYLLCTALLHDHTMFKNIHSVLPGHTVVVKEGTIRTTEYWDMELKDLPDDSSALAITQASISTLLDDSVKMRLMSDVPYGCLLSGGLDSSLISALATGHTQRKLKTFSMEYTLNAESASEDTDLTFSRLMATFLDSEHREFIIEPEEYYDFYEEVSWQVEKPVELTTPSLYLLHKNLSKYVTVILSGEGADELFGGYFFFLKSARAGKLVGFPWAPYFDLVCHLFNDDLAKKTDFKDSIHTSISAMMNRYDTTDFLNQVLYLFVKVYLVEMLERQDKTSMAWSVETRVPFLDHRLVELAANIGSQHKINNKSEKYILKETFRNRIPSIVIDRKKKPFPVPVDPRSIITQRNAALDLVQGDNSRISRYFDKNEVNDFFNRKNKYAGIDSLAIYRTSFAITALEQWHRAYGV